MRKLFYAIGAAICLATSNLASAAVCYKMNIYNNSGTAVYPGGSAIVYGPFQAPCPVEMAVFKFEDLSGNSPTNVIRHVLEKRITSSYWQPVYQVVTRNARTHSFQYAVSSPYEYRYRIINEGTSIIMNWSMEGKTPAAYIPY